MKLACNIMVVSNTYWFMILHVFSHYEGLAMQLVH